MSYRFKAKRLLINKLLAHRRRSAGLAFSPAAFRCRLNSATAGLVLKPCELSISFGLHYKGKIGGKRASPTRKIFEAPRFELPGPSARRQADPHGRGLPQRARRIGATRLCRFRWWRGGRARQPLRSPTRAGGSQPQRRRSRRPACRRGLPAPRARRSGATLQRRSPQ